LVDGDPLANLALLRDPTKLLMIMKDGELVKRPDSAEARARWSRSVA
jgi:imidazolonepropionase-like amidohydrolase